jgi:hypothetical protein
MPSAFHSGPSSTGNLEVRVENGHPVLLSYVSMRDIEYTADKIKINGDSYTVYIKGANLGPLVEALGNETALWIQVYRTSGSSGIAETEIEAITMDGTFYQGFKEGLKDGLLSPVRWAGSAIGHFIGWPTGDKDHDS